MPAAKLPNRFLSLLCFLLLSHFCPAISDELQSLLNLKSSLQKSNPNLFSTWVDTNSPCNFTGITCNSDGSVTEIELSKKNLSGTLPLDSVCQLPSLQRLSLGFNSLTGNLTKSLNECDSLEYLDLGNNNFKGSVPEISSLIHLQYLYLNLSGFSGKFPWNSLNNMTGLLSLSVGDNSFDRTPFPTEILSLKKLTWLYMSNCSISGSIPPGIGNLSELINLELSDNYLTGKIPSEISKLKKLWQLELYDNSLTGTLPAGIGNLTNLERFDASSNHLQGDLSPLKTLTRLVWLQLFQNNLSGEVPAEFGDFKSLVNLSLYSNNLTGPLPQKLGSWAEFNFIDVSTNYLTGPIPPDMCKRGTMTKLLILQNRFSGEIPGTYADCSTLVRFRVSDNNLSGVVPAGIWGLPNAEIIDVADNQLEGPVTGDIAKAKTLAKLVAGNNKISGNLPGEISRASSLVSIDFSNNQVNGEIPQSFGELKNLNSLHLENNKMSGSVPESLGSCIRLSDLNLADNSLSGGIPLSLGSLPTLNSLNLSRNELSGQIPSTLSSLRLSLLDLSYNKLSGPVPESLSIEAYNGSFAGNSELCSSNLKSFKPCSSSSSHDIHTFVICFVVGSVMLIMLSGCYVYVKRSQKKQGRSCSLKDDYLWDMKSYHVLSFTEDEILDSIKQENLVGKGGSGNVYRVTLNDGKDLAVKHILTLGGGGTERSSTPILSRSRRSKQFDSEVRTLSSIRHVNVVKLYCSITSEGSSLLVYEYMPKGSLWESLHSCEKLTLDWQTRYEIAVGAARGLEYLHHGCERPVIHRDIKSSNILLDDVLKPKIADFGLARIVQATLTPGRDSTHVIAGTHGYIAPEYGYTYKVSEKSDVYSFGVVLMELVTGKRPIEPEFGESKDLVSWVCSKLKNRETVLSMVDPSIAPEPLKEEAIKVLKIAILCTERSPELRPTMRYVVQMLEDAEPCKLVGIIVGKDGVRIKEDAIEGYESYDDKLKGSRSLNQNKRMK